MWRINKWLLGHERASQALVVVGLIIMIGLVVYATTQ